MTTQAQGNTAQIDWYLDDGVNIPMLNDILRNRFYDNILSTDLAGADCVDIGFGTGLLSMLALKHGASHVVAFEQDLNRYQLGQAIIQELGLQNQIELHHGRFSHEQLADHANQVIITETVNHTIFQEGLWHILPRAAGRDFRPGQYFFVPVRSDFVTAVNRYRNSGCSPESVPVVPVDLVPGINHFDHRTDTVWNWTPHMLLARETEAAAGFVINAELATTSVWNSTDLVQQPIDFDTQTVSLTVPLQHYPGDTFLVVPRFGLKHGDHQLLLDTGHWGPTPAVILHQCRGRLVVEQNIFSGDIAYHV